MNKEEYRLAQVIQKLDTFRDLEIEEARTVLQISRPRMFATGEVVWNPGEESTDMLVLVSGRLVVTNTDGTELAEVLPGGSFGEMGLITGHPRFVGVQAVERSLALSITHSSLDRLKPDNKDLLVKILENVVDLLAHRLTHTHHEHYRRTTPTQRDEKIW